MSRQQHHMPVEIIELLRSTRDPLAGFLPDELAQSICLFGLFLGHGNRVRGDLRRGPPHLPAERIQDQIVGYAEQPGREALNAA